MKRVSLSALGGVIGILFFLPLLWVVTNSLRPGSETFAHLKLSWQTFFELQPTLHNYSALLSSDVGRARIIRGLTTPRVRDRRVKDPHARRPVTSHPISPLFCRRQN